MVSFHQSRSHTGGGEAEGFRHWIGVQEVAGSNPTVANHLIHPLLTLEDCVTSFRENAENWPSCALHCTPEVNPYLKLEPVS